MKNSGLWINEEGRCAILPDKLQLHATQVHVFSFVDIAKEAVYRSCRESVFPQSDTYNAASCF